MLAGNGKIFGDRHLNEAVSDGQLVRTGVSLVADDFDERIVNAGIGRRQRLVGQPQTVPEITQNKKR